MSSVVFVLFVIVQSKVFIVYKLVPILFCGLNVTSTPRAILPPWTVAASRHGLNP